MTQIKLYGKLGVLFGKEHNLYLDSLSEIGMALECQSPGFKKFFADVPNYAIFVDGVLIGSKEKAVSLFAVKPALIEFFPIVMGSATTFAAWVSAAVTAAGYGSVAASVAYAAAYLVAIAVISAVTTALFAPKPKSTLNASNASAGLNSYYFGGRQNRAQQGQPIPIIYGHLKVGTYVIQAGVKNLNRSEFEALTLQGQTSDPSTTII